MNGFQFQKLKINTQEQLFTMSKTETQTSEITIEKILKNKFGVYLQNKNLIEQLFNIEEMEILQPFLYLWEAGGKKVRVIAALLLQDLFGCQSTEEVIKIGGVIELLHCASLIIDDIQDDSIQRRGKKCAHLVYGKDSCINAANLIYFKPANQLIKSFANLQTRCKIYEIFMTTMVQTHIGQGLDIKYHKSEKRSDFPSVEEYFKLTALKTGGLLKMLVRMQGVVMGISKQAIDTLVECMENVGIAFQIIDDVLNVVNQDCMGKGVIAQDLHERKFTLIVDMLRDHEEFLAIFFKKEKSQVDIFRLLQIIRDAGILEKCKEKAKQYAEKAYSCLQALNCKGDKQSFRLFIKFITQRKN